MAKMADSREEQQQQALTLSTDTVYSAFLFPPPHHKPSLPDTTEVADWVEAWLEKTLYHLKCSFSCLGSTVVHVYFVSSFLSSVKLS